MDNRFITSMRLGTLLFCCHGQAEAFDKEAAEKLLTSGPAAVGTNSLYGPVYEYDGIGMAQTSLSSQTFLQVYHQFRIL